MLVQALAEYADTHLREQLSDEAFEEKPVPFLIELDLQGTFLNVTPRTRSVTRGKKTVPEPVPLLIGRSPVPRNAGLHPLLAADDIRYVVGPGRWTVAGQERNNQERFDAFTKLIRNAADTTNNDQLKACVAFYDRPDQVEAARQALADVTQGTRAALSVAGPVIRNTDVRDYWRKHYRRVSGERSAGGYCAQCIVSGEVGPIGPTHEKIKGLTSLGGLANVALMSFDKEAFRSYGWEQNQNSPVSPDRAMAYVLALNDLLKPGNGHRRDIGDVGFIFWTKERTDFDPMSAVNADPSQVERLLKLNPFADPDPNMFYMAGVAGNGGRLLIRYWISYKLSSVKANLHNWFAGLQIVNYFTCSPAESPKLWQLLYAIDREGKPPVDRIVSLIRRAIEGPSQPLGYRVLAAALHRLRLSRRKERFDPARIGLIRLCVDDLIRKQPGEKSMSESLDPGQQHKAYLCGRLLAVYESLQYAAQNGYPNQTVADRYFSLASTNPMLAFPKLVDLGRKHLTKLRRNKPKVWYRIEEQLTAIQVQIGQASDSRYPGALSLEDQGRFVLGYHHQRAHQKSEIQVRQKQREAKNLATPKQENR